MSSTSTSSNSKAIGKEQNLPKVQGNLMEATHNGGVDQTASDSNVCQTTPDNSTQGASPTTIGPQYKVGTVIEAIMGAMKNLDAQQLGELDKFCQEVLKRPEISSKQVFLNQFLFGMRLCLRMLRKKSFAESKPGVLVDSGNVLKSLYEVGMKVSSTEGECPEQLTSLLLQIRNVEMICNQGKLKIPIEMLETAFWIFVRIVTNDTRTRSVALQHIRVFVALGDRLSYNDTSSSESVDVVKMLRIIANGDNGMPTEVFRELFDILLASIDEAKDKKTNCLDIVEAVEECLCLVLHSSSEKVNSTGCVETNKILNVLLEFQNLLTSNDVAVQEKISRLFNILMVALKKCGIFKIRQTTVVQILKLLIWNGTDSKDDLARNEVHE